MGRFASAAFVLLVGVLTLLTLTAGHKESRALGGIAWLAELRLPFGNHATLSGKVVDLTGAPVVGARVVTPRGETRSDADGWFTVAAERGAQWAEFDHVDYLSRVRAVVPSGEITIRLTPDDGETIALHFVGDTMVGRRFYDPDQDGRSNDALVRDSVRSHERLFDHVAPLLAAADLSIVNLESPLVDEPYASPIEPRPDRFHPTKSFVFASAPVLADALRNVGVDVIALSNNHIYDALDDGVRSTLRAIERAGAGPAGGLQSFGAGLNEDAAWRPAVVPVAGQTVAFLGCTTVVGREHEFDYVAGRNKGGAARCTSERIARAVEEAVAAYDAVIFMIHGGVEYDADPSEAVVRFSRIATEAGATLIVNHHPHVVGGLDWNGRSLVAWSLGNFMFDQTVWPTYASYLLAVHLRRGEVVRAYVEPLLLQRFVPTGVTGDLGTEIARLAARQPGPFVVEPYGLELDVTGARRMEHRTVHIEDGNGRETVFRLEGTWSVVDFDPVGIGIARAGKNLLWGGNFESPLVDFDMVGAGLWDVDGRSTVSGSSFAFAGRHGVQLRREADQLADAVLTHSSRILVRPGSQLTVYGMVRHHGVARASVQLSWYRDTEGRSYRRTLERLADPVASSTAHTPLESSGGWRAFAHHVVVPDDAIAVSMFIRLAPPETGVAALDADELGLVEWAAEPMEFGAYFTHLLVYGEGAVHVERPALAQDSSAVPTPAGPILVPISSSSPQMTR